MWLKTDISVYSYQIDLDIGTLETVDKFLFNFMVWKKNIHVYQMYLNTK
jgi:hypothetical protein